MIRSKTPDIPRSITSSQLEGGLIGNIAPIRYTSHPITDSPIVSHNIGEISVDQVEEDQVDEEDQVVVEDYVQGESDEFEEDIESLSKQTTPIDKQPLFTKNDAESIVGGESLKEFKEEVEVPLNPSHKVFSFSLPFGGLSNVRSNITKQLQNFKLDILNSNNPMSQLEQEMQLKLERKLSISTVDDAHYYKHIKKQENTRIRAVKKQLTSNLNELLPVKKNLKSYESIFNDIDGNIVIVGGYRGSILRDAKTHKRVWIPIKAGFNLRKINLLLGPDQECETKATDLIYPDGILANIGPIDICKRLIKKLSHNPKVNLKEFGYDWRLSADTTAVLLEKFLQEIYDKTGKPTLVIAHSMGGIITHGTLQLNPKLFRSMVYVGVPSECPNILGPLRFTDPVMFSEKILTPEVNFMMRSLFIFLPLSGRVFVDKNTKECYDLDYFDPDVWVEYNLSPSVAKKRKFEESPQSLSPSVSKSDSSFPSIITNKLKHYRSILNRSDSSPSLKSHSPVVMAEMSSEDSEHSTLEEEHFSISYARAYDYLSDTLKRAKAFIVALAYKEELELEYPPMAIVYGNQVPTLRGSLVNGSQDIKDGNYFGFFYGHGDGVVHHKSLMPRRRGFRSFDVNTGEGQIVGEFSCDSGHVSLMTDLKAMGEALSAVYEAEKIWKQSKARK